TSSKVKFGKGKGGFPMPSFLSPSPLTSLSHLWRVLVKGESGSKDALRCSMGWRMWSFHKTFDATTFRMKLHADLFRLKDATYLLPPLIMVVFPPTFFYNESTSHAREVYYGERKLI
ncbi:hypothetical protein, partial [Geobacillus sp. MR]|uniref:hypothetical protein n=1 Tax=Geobacillus sp. MR TaxID=2508875 RepID=UPI001C0EFDF5